MQINPNTKEMSMVRGDSESILVRQRDKENGELIRFVTGDTVYLTVKSTARIEDKSFQKVITDFEEDGSALIHIEPIDTKDCEFGDYVYDIQVTFADSTVKTIIETSKFRLKPEVTYE